MQIDFAAPAAIAMFAFAGFIASRRRRFKATAIEQGDARDAFHHSIIVVFMLVDFFFGLIFAGFVAREISGASAGSRASGDRTTAESRKARNGCQTADPQRQRDQPIHAQGTLRGLDGLHDEISSVQTDATAEQLALTQS
jgi:hypothetical protein